MSIGFVTSIQPRGQFQIETVSGVLPRITKLFATGLSAGSVNYLPHGLPTGAVPIAVLTAPGVTGGGLWGESQPADATVSMPLTSVTTTTGIYTGTIPDGGATQQFTLTAVTTAGVYTGTITGGANNAYAGQFFTTATFTANSGANNGTFLCTASTATTLTLQNTSAYAETHAGTATTGSLIGTYVTVAGFGNSNNNGTVQITGQTATTITTNNSSSVAQTATAATATGGFIYIEPAAGGATTGSLYVIY